MRNRNLSFLSIVLIIFLVIDAYVFQGVRVLVHSYTPLIKKLIYAFYWGFTLFTLAGLLYFAASPEKWTRLMKVVYFGSVVTVYFTKFIYFIFLVLDDIIRLFRWVFQKVSLLFNHQPLASGAEINRSDFLLKAGLAVAAVPFFGMLYGIVFGAHDYRVKRIKVKLKNLPSSFEGLRIAHISDIHSGSFYNKSAVKRGVKLLMDQQPDIVFFTGDLVNDRATEVESYIEVFKEIKAPMGVFSVLGNHDYGDYVPWNSKEERVENLKDLMNAHKRMGWDLLMDEHRILKKGNEEIALLGVQNWGKGENWPKYGKLNKAYSGTEKYPVKLLLSHDPSHWDAQVRPGYPDIDITFSGHTHGFQFGIEAAGIKWSPVQYKYKQWGGLYNEGNQYIYVNRGFGFIGFPGRMGMPPEITIMELSKA
ncbi:metallophosphoesterase [Sporocytophaga myxococcoides]|uniref:metallophosphoesterase n=1 Tax=Sporocytophaga myxococcoides TaxID=153721 RepID=UPI00048B2993|nr:metallophosphoesterase [Sporocytophaga myxococcoides]